MGYMPATVVKNYDQEKKYVNGRLISKEEDERVKDVLKGLLLYTDEKLNRDFFGAGKAKVEPQSKKNDQDVYVNPLTAH